MKCPNCGAEMGNDRVCPYCDTMMPYKNRREHEQASKRGCLKCGSSNIRFNRENQGTINKDGTKIITYQTVGFCRDCGYTWFPEESNNRKAEQKDMEWTSPYGTQSFNTGEYPPQKKKRRSWLWWGIIIMLLMMSCGFLPWLAIIILLIWLISVIIHKFF